MYEELIKKLRNRRVCIQSGGDLEADFPLMKEAAEAIEELVQKYEELLKAAKKMHTWIFLHTGDEQKAYDECGLSDEMNISLGYIGQVEFRAKRPEEEP